MTSSIATDGPSTTPSAATDGLSTTEIIIIVVFLCVALAMVLLGIVLFLTLKWKTDCGKRPAPTTGVEMLYDEVDEGQIGTPVVLKDVGKLQTITDPNPLYEAIDDLEFVSQFVSEFEHSHNMPTASSEIFDVTSVLPSDDVPTDPNAEYEGNTMSTSDNVPTDPNTAYGVTTSPTSDDVPIDPNTAYGVTTCPTPDDLPTDPNAAYGGNTSPTSDDVPTYPNTAYGVTNILDLGAKVSTTTPVPFQETESEEEDYI